VVRRLLAALAAVALLGPGFAWAEAALKPWQRGATPVLAGPSISGSAFDLQQARGKVVVINFWATWCDPCREEMPSLQKLGERMRGRPFELVTVNYGEGAEKIQAFLDRHHLQVPVVLDVDKETAKAWGAGGLPMTFLVDATGRVRYSSFGECDWNAGEPLRVVEALVAEARARAR
jgi:thiol-disulfide isomerase/thioredoxin